MAETVLSLLQRLALGPCETFPFSFCLVQVTLFVYSDLLLFTQEEEPGRCNVFRNPLYLKDVRLQEGKSRTRVKE